MIEKLVNVNMQQQPKVEGLLSCFIAREGHSIVQLDFNSIEDVVLAEASGDSSLLKIYGADHNCGYLFIGANLGVDIISDPIRKYYDPENPTKEGVALAKKHAKKQRNACKTVKLATSYGAWAPRIKNRLDAAKFPVSIEQAEMIYANYWETFAGVKDFESALKVEWRNNRGWIFNGTGRPIGVDVSKVKDLVNRYCQSTAHDLLMMLNSIIVRLRTERNVPMFAWIPDFHDECMYEVRNEYISAAKQIMVDALAELNELAGGVLKIKGTPVVAKNLWEAKTNE